MFQHSLSRTRPSLGTAATLLAAGLTLSQQVSHAQQSQARRVGDVQLQNSGATGEEWLTYGLDPGEKRYSPLTQIDATNITRLGAAWSFDIPGGNINPPGGGNQEATLLVSNGVLYGITTWSVVYAVDARTGKQLWKFDPEVNRPAVQSKICCGVVSRGVDRMRPLPVFSSAVSATSRLNAPLIDPSARPIAEVAAWVVGKFTAVEAGSLAPRGSFAV